MELLPIEGEGNQDAPSFTTCARCPPSLENWRSCEGLPVDKPPNRYTKMIDEDEINREHVQGVIEDIRLWCGQEPTIHYCKSGRLKVEVPLDLMCPDERAHLIQWYVEYGWKLEDLNTSRDTIKMVGKASKIPIDNA